MSSDPTMTELIDRCETGLAALEDTDRAIADAIAERDDKRATLDLRIAQGLTAYARRYLGDALERVESVGRAEARDRHPSSGADQ